MKIGILGSGDVAQAIGHGFVTLGHEVMLGSREQGNPKASDWAKRHGAPAKTGTFAEAASFGDLICLCTLGIATENAIRLAGPAAFRGKIVWDTTNPLDFSKGFPPALLGAVGDSGGERHQVCVPDAFVVKVFNTVGNALMFRPQLKQGTPDMFICGNDDQAKKRTAELLSEFGWNTIDTGGINASHFLESMCMIWVLAGAKSGDWGRAFRLSR